MVVMDMVITVTIILGMIIMIAMAGIAITMAEDTIAGEEERTNLRQRIQGALVHRNIAL
jgi:hypothetical protein